MLVGTSMYYRKNGRRLNSVDRDVEPGYALRCSVRWPAEYVRWECATDPHDVRWYLAGKPVDAPAFAKE